MVLNLIQPKKEDEVLRTIKDRLHEFETRIQIQNHEVERIRKTYNEALKKLEQLRLESDQFQRIGLPKFSIVTYTPKTTEYYRASYRHYDMIQQKSIPRVVHLGPTSNFKGKDDPVLIYFAQVQIVSYLMNKFPGIYADLISIK
jgi:serine phosphatase RsbU (regulator of sigma subunit)